MNVLNELSTPHFFYILLIFIAVLLPILPAYILYRTLPSSTIVGGPFQGLTVQLTGAFGGYFLIFLSMLGLIATRPPIPQTIYEVWTIGGTVTLEDPQDKLNNSNITVYPPTLRIDNESGIFQLDIPVKPDQGGKPDFPTLVVSHNGYESQSIPLGKSESTYGAKKVSVQTDLNGKTKQVAPITLKIAPKPPVRAQ